MKSLERIYAEEILIPAIIPYFLERGILWFLKHKKEIKKAHGLKQRFWKDNVIILEKDQKIQLSELLRRLDEMGYEKTGTISRPGEFSLKGGALNIFPIGAENAYLIDFFGNQIETIHSLKLDFDKKEAKKELVKRLDKESLKNLGAGDYLVHLDHGIGRFVRIGESEIRNTAIRRNLGRPERSRVAEYEPVSNDQNSEFKTGKYYVLEYAEGDRLLVPVGLEKKLSRYVGFTEPKLSRLGSPLWDRTKRKIKEGVIKTARELLKIYANRELARRDPYTKDTEFENEAAYSFQFQETPDQELAIQQVTRDLRKSEKPMDRIVCGDVGFGKTEVALRATVIVASAVKQVALLAPTTILADQHFHTFQYRLKNLPFEISLLSRLQSANEQKQILKNLEAGKTDILVGTHRLLSRDVTFKNLGLVIIDEEQKFGVRQKEKFKEMRANIDILSLSATPIPRTLYLSLSSLRDMSIIQTPPPDRLPIKTFILPWRKDTIKKACKKEISRKGQVYYLHNRVETIDMAKRKIKQILPNAKIGVAHGRMSEQTLIETMNELRDGKIDVLCATTIIENGLDLPNVNTIIVADATKLGLAQAYQIRGRIGRSHIQAYAYFLYPRARFATRLNSPSKFRSWQTPQRNLFEKKAFQRLEALKEAEELGSGYQIALRDLEIRGAGNILGKEQSGSINKVGLNLYCQMLSEIVEEMKNKKQDCDIKDRFEDLKQI